MVLMQAGCYWQSLSNDPASMLAGHWLSSPVSLAGFLLNFPALSRSTPPPAPGPPKVADQQSVQERHAPLCDTQLRLGEGAPQESRGVERGGGELERKEVPLTSPCPRSSFLMGVQMKEGPILAREDLCSWRRAID